jgi:hypothetical protein
MPVSFLNAQRILPPSPYAIGSAASLQAVSTTMLAAELSALAPALPNALVGRASNSFAYLPPPPELAGPCNGDASMRGLLDRLHGIGNEMCPYPGFDIRQIFMLLMQLLELLELAAFQPPWPPPPIVPLDPPGIFNA